MALPTFPEWFYFSMLASQGWPRKSGMFGNRSVPTLMLDMLGKQLGDLGRALGAEHPEIAMRLITQSLGVVRTLPAVDFMERGFSRSHANGWPAFSSQPFGEDLKWDTLLKERGRIVHWFSTELWQGLTRPDEVRQTVDSDLHGSRARGEKARDHGLDLDPSLLTESVAELAAQGAELFEAYEAAGGVVAQADPSLVRYVESLRTG